MLKNNLLMKIFKKDLLNLKYNDDDTYWIKKNEPKSKNQPDSGPCFSQEESGFPVLPAREKALLCLPVLS